MPPNGLNAPTFGPTVPPGLEPGRPSQPVQSADRVNGRLPVSEMYDVGSHSQVFG